MLSLLSNLVNVLASDSTGMVYIGIGLMSFALGASGIGEGYVCGKTVETMGRNPEMYSKLRTSMILGCALTETTAIYGLLMCILMLFVG